MMKLLLVALVSTLLVGCGEPDENLSPGAGGDGDTPVASTPLDDAPAPDGSPSYTVPQPGQEDLRAIGWDDYVVRNDGRSLHIKYWSGVEPCNVLDHVDVVEEPDRVVVTVWEGSSPSDEPTACIEIAVLKTTVVELDRPLGGRKVVDGSS